MPAYGRPDDSPLTNRDYTRIQEALASLSKAQRKCDIADAAGIDCEQRKAEIEYLQQRIDKMKAVYFPDKP